MCYSARPREQVHLRHLRRLNRNLLIWRAGEKNLRCSNHRRLLEPFQTYQKGRYSFTNILRRKWVEFRINNHSFNCREHVDLQKSEQWRGSRSKLVGHHQVWRIGCLLNRPNHRARIPPSWIFLRRVWECWTAAQSLWLAKYWCNREQKQPVWDGRFRCRFITSLRYSDDLFFFK